MTSIRSSKTVAIGILSAAVAILIICGAAQAAPVPPKPTRPQLAKGSDNTKTITAQLPTGRETLIVSSTRAVGTRARSTQAWPASDPTTIWTLSSRVIVSSTNPDPLTLSIKDQGLLLAPLAFTARWPVPYYTIDTASVEAAIALADRLRSIPGVQESYVDATSPRQDRSVPTDPLVPSQWHLINPANPLADLNIEPAWAAGYIGTGVTVGVLEGGWNIGHTDLSTKYALDASQPGEDFGNHATSVAGIIGAAANNALGGTGIAHGASLSRLYYGDDTATAEAFAFRNDLNAIKSNSWGPSDIGRAWTMSDLQRQALTDAATTGRDGKGTVIVWAAGNGRTINNDRVDYDPWASHPWVIAVGAVGHTDTLGTFSEPGSSVMVVAPSRRTLSGPGDLGIVTTTDASTYTTSFGGTSAAAPMVAGVVALMLQANANLSVRDVMHILINTARRCDPANASWFINGAGRWTSDDYGFGAVDAGAATATAANWQSVPNVQAWTSPSQTVGMLVPDNAPASSGGGVASTILVPRRLIAERAIVRLTLPHAAIGQLRITLTSPQGTVSRLATPRSDNSANRYLSYMFTSLRSWGEATNGTWTLRASDEAAGTDGTFDSWQIEFLGTPLSRLADWNQDSAVDLLDLLAFLNDWTDGAADANADELVDLLDLLGFLDVWLAELGT